MREKLLICVSALQASAALWRAGKISRIEQFAHDERGLAGFREFLAQHANVPVLMMVDAVEEDYRFETLPHSWGAERAQMVLRKLKQHYRTTPYIGAWLQGREADKRRDDRYLLAALTNPDIVADWLRIVAAQSLPLVGLYLLPIVSGALINKLQVNAPNLLLAAQHTGGLRLTFFRDRQFRLSRLTRGDSVKATDPLRLYTGEITNTRLYLHALRTATLDEQLTVALVDRNDELAEVAEAILQDNPALECVRVGRAELAKALQMDAELLASSPDALYLHLLGMQPPSSNIAPAAATTGYRHYRARRAIYASCAGICAVATLWAGVNAGRAFDVHGDASAVARQAAAQDAQYQQITQQFPPTPTTGENLKRAVDLARTVHGSARDPMPVMIAVSQALQTMPNIMLRELGWRHGTTEIEKGSSESHAPGPRAPGAPILQRRESAYLSGEIRPFNGDYRAAIETINGLAARLRADPAVAEVRTTKMPLNVSPTAALSGNTLDASRPQRGTAEFELSVVLKPRT